MLARVRQGLRLEDVLVLRLHHRELHLAGRGLTGHLQLALSWEPGIRAAHWSRSLCETRDVSSIESKYGSLIHCDLMNQDLLVTVLHIEGRSLEGIHLLRDGLVHGEPVLVLNVISGTLELLNLQHRMA